MKKTTNMKIAVLKLVMEGDVWKSNKDKGKLIHETRGDYKMKIQKSNCTILMLTIW